jgi:hypothetical protein
MAMSMKDIALLKVINRTYADLYKQISDLLEQLSQLPPEGLDINAPFDPWIWR